MQPTNGRTEKINVLRKSVEEHGEALARQLAEGKSDTLIQYLEFCSQFHAYSFRNILLAIWQKPDITHIAGIRQWNKLGRRVRAGEKGIAILAPITVKRKSDSEGEVENDEVDRITLFKPVYVFDVSQTEGEPLPDIIHASGDVGDVYQTLAEVIAREGILIEVVAMIPASPTARGVSCGGRILLRSDLKPADAFRTLTHEYAHERLHRNGERESKAIRETEADATAFIVCRHFGIETDTADYLLLHDASPTLLLARLETIRQTAAAIIEALESFQTESPSDL